MVQAFKEYYLTLDNIEPMNPKTMLYVTIGGYIGPRLLRPTVQQRLFGMFETARGWFRKTFA